MTQENEAKVKKKKTKKVKSQKYDAEAGVNDKKRLKGIASFSLIIALFDRLWEIICNALVNGFWGNVCSSYTKLQNSYENGFIREFIFRDRRIKRLFRKFRKFLSSQIENCFLVTYGRKTLGFFTSIPLSYYGNFTLFFGIYTIVVFFVKQIIPDIESAGIDYLIFGGSMIVISLPLLFTKLSVASAVMRSTIAKSIIQGCFGVSDEVLARKSSARKGRGNIMLFFGLVAGTLSFFVHPLVIVLFLLVVAILSFVAVTPEIGVLITAFIIPFCSFVDNPTITLSCCVLVTAFFYVIKLIRGKRIFKLELVDGTVLLFGIVIYFASVFSAGGEASRNAALISCVLMLGYFLLVNLMRTEKWIKRCKLCVDSSSHWNIRVFLWRKER